MTDFQVAAPTIDPDGGTAVITFDFLDHLDGGLIKVLTTGPGGTVQLVGDIIGMPEGIKSGERTRSTGFLNAAGCTLGILLQVAALVLTPLVYRWTTGSWDYAWLLILPILALFVPGLLVGVVASTIWPDSTFTFPSELTPPRWFFGRLRSDEIRHLRPDSPDMYGFGVSVHRNKLRNPPNELGEDTDRGPGEA